MGGREKEERKNERDDWEREKERCGWERESLGEREGVRGGVDVCLGECGEPEEVERERDRE